MNGCKFYGVAPSESGKVYPVIKCGAPVCQDCGWNKVVQNSRRKQLRKKEANGTLVDKELRERALRMYEEDEAGGMLEVDSEGHIIWRKKGRVYR